MQEHTGKPSEDKEMIFEQVRDALAQQFEVEPESITMDTNLIDDLGADSLDVVELIMSLEDAFGVAISDEDAAQLYTVGKIVDYLEKLQ
jgi:acyl carrier protein